MAEPMAAGGPAGKMVIRNVGLMLSGDLQRPILDGGWHLRSNAPYV